MKVPPTRGSKSPGECEPFTQIPNAFLDRHLADLTGGETKTYLYICRRTKGFNRTSDSISITQLCEGIRKRDGTVLDRGTGLTRESQIAAVGGLEHRGFVVRTRGAGTIPDTYAPMLQWSENPTASGTETRPVSSRKTGPLSGRKTRPTIERGKSSSERKGKAQNPKPFTSKVDDEKTIPRTPLENPEMEFCARMARRHGPTVDAKTLLKQVKADLRDVTLPEFLEADLKATTAPEKLINAAGYYRKLAKDLARDKGVSAVEEVLETAAQARAAMAPNDAPYKPPCSACKDGALPGGGGYCTCKAGQLRGEVDRRRDVEIAV